MRVVRGGVLALVAALAMQTPARGQDFIVASAPDVSLQPHVEPDARAPGKLVPLTLHDLDGSAGRPERKRLRPHHRTPLTALSLLMLPRPERQADAAPRRTLTVTVAGDLGLGGHMQPVREDGALKHGALIRWPELTERVRPLLDGDLNFANLETAVTDRNGLQPEGKSFNFRAHPAGVRHLAGIGLNLMATANNHSMDFGEDGAIDTISHLEKIRASGALKAHAGLGRNREEAGRPQLVPVRDSTVAFSAIGIVSSGFPLHRAGENRPGQMAYQSADDFGEVARRLGEAKAAYRILSVHQGIEREVQTNATAIQKLRLEAVIKHGVDLVVGHHAHVVQGIEIVGGKLIFYGLGNFLHPGMQNMASMGLCRDYGLFARVHLASDETGRFSVRAVEAIPLTDMHYKAQRLAPAAAAERIQVLNHLASGLDDTTTGARGVRFAAQADGSGLYCVPGADADGSRVGQLCRGWRGPDVATAAQRGRVQAACGGMPSQLVKAREPQPSKVQASAPVVRRAEASPFSFLFGQ